MGGDSSYDPTWQGGFQVPAAGSHMPTDRPSGASARAGSVAPGRRLHVCMECMWLVVPTGGRVMAAAG